MSLDLLFAAALIICRHRQWINAGGGVVR